MARKHKKKKPAAYRERTYRQLVDAGDLESFEIHRRETDLHVLTGGNSEIDFPAMAENSVLLYRTQLENHIARHPEFLYTLNPVPEDPRAPAIIREMIKAGRQAHVGPMAAVAGAIAEFVGRDLLQNGAGEVMVENGGDIFLCRRKSCTVAIFAGISPLSNQVGVRIEADRMPLGICTSSGSVGHSLSFGKSDSVTVLATSVCLADAAATRLGNEVSKDNEIERALEVAGEIDGLAGVVIILDQRLGAWGEVELVNLS